MTRAATSLPTPGALEDALKSLETKLPVQGCGESYAAETVEKIVAALPNHDSKYYGFVTGGATPAARAADFKVIEADENCMVHLPDESIASAVEDAALRMIIDLNGLDQQTWTGRTLTTGATASNVLAMMVAREHLLGRALAAKGASSLSVGEDGLCACMQAAGVAKIQVLAAMCHSSMGKAVSMAGFGRRSISQEARSPQKPWSFDLARLEQALATANTLSIVVANSGEVNTGMYTDDLAKIRQLCDKYGAWLHVDGAFGIYLRALAGDAESPYADFASRATVGIELADSITGDNHKTLNVPYDSGFFLTRSSELMFSVFQNAGAAYLPSSAGATLPSPMNIGIENSRRFRALPAYATLVAYGRDGYARFIDNVIELCRSLASWIDASPDYELLAVPADQVCTVVLFRARDAGLNSHLKERINATRQVYVSPSAWDGQPAVRVAPCNWNTCASDCDAIVAELQRVVAEYSA